MLGTGHIRGVWPVLLILLAAVLVPTACVLWFMGRAMRNERLAVRQTIEQTYRAQMPAIRRIVQTHWRTKLAAIAAAREANRPAESFARLVRQKVCDSAVLYESNGRLAYPRPAEPPPPDLIEPAAWSEAVRLEFDEGRPEAALGGYAQVAEHAFGESLPARALLGQARCLAKTGQPAPAVEILLGRLAGPRYRQARDELGRLVAPDAHLMALRLMGDPARQGFQRAAAGLADRLRDYGEPPMPASQRRFLMRQLRALATGQSLDTLAAEDLAAEHLDAGPADRHEGRLAPSRAGGIWMLPAPGGAAVGLFRQGRVVGDLEAAVAAGLDLPGAKVTFLPRARDGPPAEAFVSALAGEPMGDWEIAVALVGADPFAQAAARQAALYLWTGGLSIAAVMVLAALLAGYVSRQMKLTRLKNDLIATVSHELKTPLASMRVLIDTLLAGRCRDERQAKDYFALLARENLRLSRLIDNFLAFSRMERNKKAFEFTDLDVSAVVREAVESVRERFAAPGSSLEVRVEPDLPAVAGDRDALLTVLLNLLDNAWKYTRDDKRVAVRASAVPGGVRLAVQDNGIGLSRRNARRVFDRFFQADRSLSGSLGGCGLGLSIVKFIASAHGGSVAVDSRLGRGSTFAVTLPAAGTKANPVRPHPSP